MNSFYKTLILLFIAATPFLSIAQKNAHEPHTEPSTTHQHTPWCASEVSDEQLRSLEEFVDYYYYRGGKAEMTAMAASRATIYVPLAYHLVADTDGSGRYPLSKALNDLCTLNADMLHTNIQFYLKHNINLSINNDVWNEGTGGFSSAQLTVMVPFANKTNAINMYQVKRIRADNGIAGYAHGSVFHNTSAPNATQSAVFIKKGTGGNDQTMAHEFGHNFSLPHTFYGWESQTDYVCGSKAPAWAERYSGANCTTQGDRFCDTAPDYTSGFTCSGTNNLNTGCLQMDADSATGYADGSNIMSYGFNCSSRIFSADQIAAMTWNLTNLRGNLITTTPNTTAITGTPNLTAPVGNANDSYDATTFTWDAVPNATHYAIEINRTPTFPEGLMVDMAIVANGTTYTSTKLAPSTNYHWRIIPYNEGYFCAGPSTSKAFTSSDFASNTNTITGVERIELMPNPTHSGQSVNLLIQTDKAFEAGISIYDISGRLISNEQTTISTGTTVHPIKTIGLSAGIYMVAVNSQNGLIHKKLVITE
jgi:hypothetical protein